MIMALAKGQKDLKALILKDKRKKPKKPTGLVNLGRRIRGLVQRASELVTSSKEGDNQEEETREEDSSPKECDDEFDYDQEQYPPTDEKYKQLEDHLNAMEVRKVPILDFEELGLVSGVSIPQKFKVPVLAKYDGVSCPKMHLRSYVRKIQPHTTDKDLWIHFFQDSLFENQLEWFYQLERANIL